MGCVLSSFAATAVVSRITTAILVHNLFSLFPHKETGSGGSAFISSRLLHGNLELRLTGPLGRDPSPSPRRAQHNFVGAAAGLHSATTTN